MYNKLKSLLFLLSPENAHRFAFWCGTLIQNSSFLKKIFLRYLRTSSAELSERKKTVQLWGLEFKNPIGLAAGFDKNGELPPLLQELGFGFLEVGTVTPRPQVGNPKPRLFRDLASRSIFNRMGFNNKGCEALRKNLESFRSQQLLRVPVGVNLGKNKDTPNEASIEDYRILAQALKDQGDYFVINISSPNTPGLRDLQNETFLTSLYQEVSGILQKPLLVKLAPDMENQEFEALVVAIEKIGYQGLILCNTTLDKDYAKWTQTLGPGGISGRPLRLRSRELLLMARRLVKIPIISVGGIDSEEEIRWRLEHGAQLVQVYSELIFSGPHWIYQLSNVDWQQ